MQQMHGPETRGMFLLYQLWVGGAMHLYGGVLLFLQRRRRASRNRNGDRRTCKSMKKAMENTAELQKMQMAMQSLHVPW